MKSRFRIVGLLSAALLIFAMGGGASADNAASIKVAISYPCSAQDAPCNTGAAVSRHTGGDKVNVYITLLDAAGNPATAGPNGESLTTLTASLTSQLGKAPDAITPNKFLADTENVAFAGKPSARAYIDYTGANVGVDPLNVAITGATPLIGQANVNVVAPPAQCLVVRTCAEADYDLYDPIDDPCENEGKKAEAGSAIKVQVIAVEGNGKFTTAPNLQGKQIIVNAYADYNDNESIEENTKEAIPVATGTFTMSNGIAEGTLTINNAGPAGLRIVFLASAAALGEEDDGEVEDTCDIDVAEMIPGDPAAVIVADDRFENGNLIVPVEDNCVTVLDDCGECGKPGTATAVTLVIVDALGNAVDAEGTVTVTGTLDGILDDQLDGCSSTNITGYKASCALQDTNEAGAGSIVIGPLPFTAPGLTGTSSSVYLLPAKACGDLDMKVTVPSDAIDAGDTVRLTIASDGGNKVVREGHDLLITAGGGTQLLSANGFASATTTLQINNVLDADASAPGIQVDIQMYGPCTDSVEPVAITVTDLDQCGAKATSGNIDDIKPGDAATLAVVGLDQDMETESVLDTPGSYVGTAPIVIDSYIIADGKTYNKILDDNGDCCDLQIWDQFANAVECEPKLIVCTTDSGFALPVKVSDCDVEVAFAPGAAGTTATVTCGVNLDSDSELELTRTFRLVNIVNQIPEEQPSGAATALAVVKEGPQAQNGAQINPLPGGEAIIKILPNGTLASSVNVQVSFGAGSVAGAELRNLNGTPVILPVTITLPKPFSVKRYVVYAPAAGQVVVNVTAVSATGLAAGTGTIVFGAACEVAITPASPTVPQGGTLQLSATTTCEGTSTPGTYTWAVVDFACTSSGSVSASGLYTAPATADAGGCTETVRVTDTANGNVSADVIIAVSECTPVVQITPDNPTLTVGATQVFTAATTCDSTTLPGTYSWELAGAAVGTGNSYTFNATAAGTKTLKVTDTANNATDTVTITVVSGCDINVVQEQVFRSRWVPLPALITIVGDGTEITFATQVNYASTESPLSVIKVGKLVFRNVQTIQQPVLVMPSLLTGVRENETITVTITNGGCDTASDTFDIELLPFSLDQQQ